ncbi:MAG: glycine cleavage system protein GcvH [Eubacteriales bacterium]|nr:glycine cleavage system protein GcvH [Eubacteriales bacterium]
MKIPNELLYYKSHEWVKMEGDTALVGITDYAQNELGDLVYINLPNVGDEVNRDDAFADVESVKAVSDVLSPLAGTVSEVNEELIDAPELINQDAYAAWIVRLKDLSDMDDLMNAQEYEEFLKKEA